MSWKSRPFQCAYQNWHKYFPNIKAVPIVGIYTHALYSHYILCADTISFLFSAVLLFFVRYIIIRHLLLYRICTFLLNWESVGSVTHFNRTRCDALPVSVTMKNRFFFLYFWKSYSFYRISCSEHGPPTEPQRNTRSASNAIKPTRRTRKKYKYISKYISRF